MFLEYAGEWGDRRPGQKCSKGLGYTESDANHGKGDSEQRRGVIVFFLKIPLAAMRGIDGREGTEETGRPVRRLWQIPG